jgi:hypothetical protein
VIHSTLCIHGKISDMSEPPESLLTAFLAQRDHACPQCHYNLRDLQGTRCPECGEALVLGVHVAEPRQAAAIAGLIGLSAGVGLNGLLIIYAIIATVIENRHGIDLQFWLTTAIGFIVETTVLIIWLRCWRSIRRQSFAARVALSVGCWLLTLADIVFFSLTIR